MVVEAVGAMEVLMVVSMPVRSHFGSSHFGSSHWLRFWMRLSYLDILQRPPSVKQHGFRILGKYAVISAYENS